MPARSSVTALLMMTQTKLPKKLKNAEVVVWATPVYYYEMCGQMKTMIDRANPLFASDYKFREVYLITTSADGDDAVNTVISGLNGWIACFNGVKFCGYVSGGGIDSPSDVQNHKELLEKAYNLGKKYLKILLKPDNFFRVTRYGIKIRSKNLCRRILILQAFFL